MMKMRQERMNCECGDHVSTHNFSPLYGNSSCAKCPCTGFRLVAEQPVKKPELNANKLIAMLGKHYNENHPNIPDKEFTLRKWGSITCSECIDTIYASDNPDV
jgi:hypothetical protein